MTSFRVDLGTLRPAQRMTDGRVRVEAHITRAGVFTYMNADGSLRRELRDPREVFDAASMRSFEQLPVTNLHPYEPVNSKNARSVMVGANDSNVLRDDDHMRTMLMVADEETVKEMESGSKVQVSCGYTCDYDPTPGVHPVYGKYDGKQTKIRGNHIALVPNARAGETARVRMDAFTAGVSDIAVMRDDSQTADRPRPITHDKEITMTTSGATTQNMIDTAATLLATEKTRADAAITSLEAVRAELATATKRADTAEGALRTAREMLADAEKFKTDAPKLVEANAALVEMTKRLDAANAELIKVKSPESMREAVRARVRIESAARSVLGDRYAVDHMNDRDLMTEVIAKTGKAIDAKESDDFVRAAFNERVDGFLAGERALSAIRIATEPAPGQRADTAEDARKKMAERNQNAWRTKTAD